MGSVCQQPNSKSDQSACSGKQHKWFNYKTKDVKIDETKHPQKCFPFETILLLTAELKKKSALIGTRYVMLLMSNLALAVLFSILPHTTSLFCNVFKWSQWQVSCFPSVTLDRPDGKERDQESWRVKTANNKSENSALITNDKVAGERLVNPDGASLSCLCCQYTPTR